jgi:hypothetical protein
MLHASGSTLAYVAVQLDARRGSPDVSMLTVGCVQQIGTHVAVGAALGSAKLALDPPDALVQEGHSPASHRARRRGGVTCC